ncbi:hypothetical protein [Candidatus Cytomitobacter primus]|uniref:Outer membrane protein beta-barrel domain-containing protein n=1 Tax=Candidatus Cytomitobacter primus TaxID=2066024 RepID=A0A5C0UG52_9PROT|nr:hypothetical protein [Candidatus Cytomitobacter primus]QEK38707.1 hypothetical protein FZC34_02185 [Candidatus Cytomitobacter primus]
MFIRSALISCMFAAHLYANTGIGIALGSKDFKQPVIKSDNDLNGKKMKTSKNFSFGLSFDHWNNINRIVHIGGSVNIGIVNKTITYTSDELDLKIKNDNLNLELFAKIGIGSRKMKIYTGPGICATRFKPEASFIDMSSGIFDPSNNNKIEFDEKSIFVPFFGVKSGMYFEISSKLSFDISYIWAVTSFNRLESKSFGLNSISPFDSRFFRFKPKVSRAGLSIHYRIS